MEGREDAGRSGGCAVPGVFEPARPDLGVRPAMDAAGGPKSGAPFLNIAEVAVVAEREPTGRIVERLGVGHAQR